MNRQDELRPCILICPGGGYAICSEQEAEPIALKFLELGFNVFILTYSVAPNRFPTQLLEVAAIMGFSAGGHLAAHYATMYDCKKVRAQFPKSKAINASILCYPVITADSNYGHQGSFVNLLGHEPTETEINYFSCDHMTNKPSPTTAYVHQWLDAAKKWLKLTFKF